jgi:RNA polymerase sigma factor (sigma-70 family)
VDDETTRRIPDRAAESASLLNSAANGDAQSLEALIVRHLPDLRAFVRLRIDPVLRAHESGSDLVQSVCLEVLAHPDRFEFRGETAFRNWLYGAVLHKIAAHRERYLAKKRRPPGRQLTNTSLQLAAAYTTRFDPTAAIEQKELVERLEKAFDVLSAEQREILTLHRIVGLSHAEIAAKFGRTEESTRQVLHRALAQLAVALKAG